MGTDTTCGGNDQGAERGFDYSAPAIVPIELRNLCDVAEVHRRAFPRSALSRLGPEAVRRFYEWQMIGPHDHWFVGAFNRNQLQGYAVGGKSRGALSGFVHGNKYYLVCRAFMNPLVIFTEHGRKAVRSALRALRRRPRKTTVKTDEGRRSFGIQVIAVDPTFQSKGIGKVLMAEMERVARARGCARMHLTVNLKNTQAIAFYERIGWTRSHEISVWEQGMEKLLTRV